ncbi:MAG TPA: LysE family translocator [Pseudolabrys sp.]|nr:LysE family translocator [Pseudolabrys sp.]
MNPELFTAFVFITLLLMLTPGPIVTLVISTGARQGTRAALVTVAGTTFGNAVLIGSIAAGLSIVVRHAAVLFEILRWAGAAYLIWLGIQAWRHAGKAEDAVAAAPRGRVHFTRGVLVALSNPKTIAFFTAFLPQFVDPALPVERQLLVMCVVSVLLAGLTDCLWATAAGAGRTFFLAPGRARLLDRLSSLALIGGGIWLSLARRPG